MDCQGGGGRAAGSGQGETASRCVQGGGVKGQCVMCMTKCWRAVCSRHEQFVNLSSQQATAWAGAFVDAVAACSAYQRQLPTQEAVRCGAWVVAFVDGFCPLKVPHTDMSLVLLGAAAVDRHSVTAPWQLLVKLHCWSTFQGKPWHLHK